MMVLGSMYPNNMLFCGPRCSRWPVAFADPRTDIRMPTVHVTALQMLPVCTICRNSGRALEYVMSSVEYYCAILCSCEA